MWAHQCAAHPILLFVACSYRNFRSTVIKTDSRTPRLCVYNGTSTAWSKRVRRFPTSSGQHSNSWWLTQNPGEAGKRTRQQVDLPLRKLGRENRCRSYTPGQAWWVTMSTHVHLNVFKVFLWRLCKKKLNGVQYTNLKIKPNCQLSDGILAFDAIKIRNRFVPLKCYEAKLVNVTNTRIQKHRI